GSSADVQFDPNSPLGKLQQLGEKLEKSNADIEAAGKSGDPNAQAAAAIAGLGALLGGGSRVDPIALDELKQFVPESFAGLQRTSSKSERNGMAGVTVATAEAVYGGSSDRRVTLEVSDTGGVSGLMGLASWAGVESEKEDDSGSERTQKVNGRLVHEKISKTGGRNEYSIVLGDRFVVTAKGDGVEFDALKSGVGGLDLGKLESMKSVGVTR
ncbi:MAG: YIP1 family protein, partial [Casimicrobiaceae bacterium]